MEIRRFYTYDSPFGFMAMPDADYIERTIPLLQRLPCLEVVYLEERVGGDMEAKLRTAIPHCEIVRIRFGAGGSEWDD